ncbi:MAG: S49 family peptidase, partial [Thermodesulfobacteriota bacterium]
MDFLDKLFGTFDKSNFVQIRLSGEIPEEEEKSFLPTMGAKKSLTMWDIEKVLTHVENSAKLLGVIISLSELRIGFARANLIRQRLSEIRASGKKVIVHLESGGNIEYLIASAADKIYMTPWGTLNLIGLKAEVTFYKDALDKIGVSANMKGFGEYKSAAETFTRDSMSTPHKEMMDSILDDLQTQLEGHISKGRGITPKEVKNLIDNGPYMTDIAQDNALIDGVCYETQLEENISILLQADLSVVKAG